MVVNPIASTVTKDYPHTHKYNAGLYIYARPKNGDKR